MTDKDENAMSDELLPDAPEPREPKAPATVKSGGGGFFTIYKLGQGKWTRLGTLGGAAIIAMLTSHFIYEQMRTWTFLQVKGQPRYTLIFSIIGLLVALYCLLVFWLTNKSSNADFLIATDSEMKKVNWTSRRELIGSTKVVIGFMFLVAGMLFLFDVLFGYFFYLIGVLKSKPF